MSELPVRRDDASPVAATRTRPWVIVSVTAISWAAFTMTVLHLISSRSPIRDTLSSYTVTDRGGGMLEASVLSLAIGSIAVLGALVVAGTPLSTTTYVLFSAWALGLAVAAIFPASYGQVGRFEGEVHRYASLLAFLSLPGAVHSLLERTRSVPALAKARAVLAKLLVISLYALALFGISYLLDAFQAVPVVDELSELLPVGLTQRFALVADVGLLLAVVMLASRMAAARREQAPETVY